MPLTQLWRDLKHPDVLWQLLALISAVILAFIVSLWINRWLDEQAAHTGLRRVGRAGARRLVFPVTALIIVSLCKIILATRGTVTLLAIANALLLSWAGIRAVFYILKKTFSQKIWLDSFEKTFAIMVWSIVALHLIGLLNPIIDNLRQVDFTLGAQVLNLWILLKGFIAVFVTIILALWIGGIFENRINLADGINSNLKIVLVRLEKVVLMVLAVMITLPLMGIDLTTLSIFGGALGVGLGFGLQKIAANYVSGFIILLDHSLRIGDLITVNGENGQVTRITTRYTILRAQNGVEIIIPNELLISNVVRNDSFSDSQVRIAITLQVAYDSNIVKVLALLEQLALLEKRVLTDPEPKAFVVEFADSGIKLELGVWINDPENGILSVRSTINLAILQAFAEQQIKIPYPQREITMLS